MDSVETSGVADSDRCECLPRANYGKYPGLAHGAENLVIVGDSRLAIQQSLGVIACRKDSLITLLNRHREIVAKLKSVRYLHVVREYNAAASLLAGEALESNVSKVSILFHALEQFRSFLYHFISSCNATDRKTEVKELNRTQERIYEPSSDNVKVENTGSGTFVQILDGKTRRIHAMDSDILLQCKPFVDVAHQERAEVSATTRSQTKTKKKRVHFEDEVSGLTTTAEATEAATEHSETQVRNEPTADDIDPVTVQEERRRRIAQTQDEELGWSNLKAVLRCETTTMTYKEAREAWKWVDNFALLSNNVLYSRRKVEENLPGMSLRLVVPTTMIQERVKHDYYWIGLYVDVEKHVKSCLVCSSSNSPGNVLAERSFQVVSIDFVISLPRSRRGNTALLL
ncbi:hypothetical protein PHMEG_0009996 [Phytophthora megakarya]|uniref:Integrase zinc-binding domain-containing protein n=1 Tax=Phytophthora megakarya TaxID=4795 RepID=A0A225WG54_9STRA|nr:hypothetical protein PHMEG_0009996 [Phytophthora megakarya]